MESVSSYDQNSQNLQQPTTSQPSLFSSPPVSAQEEKLTTTDQQNSYQVKCGLLDYHIQEAILINKALRSELKQYKDKIDFEKKLRKFLVERVKGTDS